MVLFPVLVVLVRLIASIPFMERIAGRMLNAIEALFTTGGVADMYAIVQTQVTAAAIHARTRNGLTELERMVRPGGTITLVAHSGGGPLGWWLLSEPPIHQRQASARFRYRLITVGAALNWALRGFRGYGTPLDRPLVNHQAASAEDRTWWMNVYGTWDPVSHGPVPASDFRGWHTWPEPGAPNRAVRNLGAPVPDEHGEYWRNQQEFVPLVWRAVVPDSAWAEEQAGAHHRLWSNCRLALMSALVRTRLVIIAVPVAAILGLLRGQRFIGDDAYESAVVGALGDIVGGVVKNAIGEDGLRGLTNGLEAAPLLAGALVVGLLTLFAYALSDIYTNFFWRALGRRVESLRPAGGRRCTLLITLAVVVWLPALVILPGVLRGRDAGIEAWLAVAALNLALLILELLWVYRLGGCRLALPALLTWAPSIVVLPLLLGDFHLGWPSWSVITALNTAVAVAEIHWFFGCIRSLDNEALAERVYGQPIGRQRKETAAPDSAKP